MTDYFEMVPRTAPSELRTFTVTVDDEGIVTVKPAHGSRALTFELVFGTVEGRDAFLESPRRRMDATRCTGSLTIVTPSDLLTLQDARWTEQGRISRTTKRTMARAFGLSETDISIGFMQAWSAVIEWYQQQR